LGTNTTSCFSSTSVWITNFTASITSTGTVNVKFTVAGGSNSLPYDVFAASRITRASTTKWQWAWMGQAVPCVTNLLTITTLPAAEAFLMLGTPQDRDADGLTDAFELLVTHSDPNKYSTRGDGIGDGVAYLLGHNLFVPGMVPDTNNVVNLQI